MSEAMARAIFRWIIIFALQLIGLIVAETIAQKTTFIFLAVGGAIFVGVAGSKEEK